MNKNLKKLSRVELLELMVGLSEDCERLSAENAHLKKMVASRQQSLQQAYNQQKQLQQQNQQIQQRSQREVQQAQREAQQARQQAQRAQQVRQAQPQVQQGVSARVLPRSTKVGSIAEAALQANGYFEAAQRSADDYLREIKRLRDQLAARAESAQPAPSSLQAITDQQAQAIVRDAQQRARQIVDRANAQAEAIVADAKKRSEAALAQANRQSHAAQAEARQRAAEGKRFESKKQGSSGEPNVQVRTASQRRSSNGIPYAQPVVFPRSITSDAATSSARQSHVPDRAYASSAPVFAGGTPAPVSESDLTVKIPVLTPEGPTGRHERR